MSSRLLFPDAHAARDAVTFAGRAATLGADAVVRLRAAAGTLVMSTAALAPRTLLDDVPTVLALRALPVDPELECDLVVTAPGVAATDDPCALALPATAVSAPWAGIAPPQRGWRRYGEIPASVLAARAQWGMSAVAHALPADAGEELVRSVRGRVWGEDDDRLDALPRAVAFAAATLGFIHGEEAAVIREAPGWVRVTLRRGHVLVRRTVRSGLTPVRRTGNG
ncbi:MAG: hypothetical protein QM604_02730 [Microbacterium sp.]